MLRNPCGVKCPNCIFRISASIAPLLSPVPAFQPGKTNSSGLQLDLILPRIANARAHSGTLCSRPAFIRSAGTVQTSVPRSISDHLAPITSPVRPAVNIINSNARAELPDRLCSAVMNFCISLYGTAGWCLTRFTFAVFTRILSRCPRRRAGFSPSTYFRARA